MALTERTAFTSATVGEFGHISVRIDRVIYDGTTEVSRIPHRHVLAPGDDLAREHQRVKDIAAAAWTPDVLASYRAMQAAALAAKTEADALLPQLLPKEG